MPQLASIASDAGSLQSRKNQAGSFIPRATPYARFYACHERCSDGCHCGTTWSRRYAHDRKTLRAPCAELRCGHDPRTFSHAWNYRGKLCDAHATGGLKGIGDLDHYFCSFCISESILRSEIKIVHQLKQPVGVLQASVCLVDDALR